MDPVYALEYLIKLTESSKFKSAHPTIYKNSLVTYHYMKINFKKKALNF